MAAANTLANTGAILKQIYARGTIKKVKKDKK